MATLCRYLLIATLASFCAGSGVAQNADAHPVALPIQGESALQTLIDAAAPYSVIRCDPNQQLVLSRPVVIQKPLTLTGLHARLPEKLGNTSLVVVEAKSVAIIDFEFVGNADSVPQKERAPLLIIHAGDFRVERGLFVNSSKDGVMIDGDGSPDEDLTGGVVRDVVGRRVRRDVVSISGSSGRGRKIRNVLVENVRCYESALRGAVEVSDGTDNITVRKVYAKSAVYAIDVQDHHQPEQSNRNVLVEDVYATKCRHAIRTANTRRGHANLTLRDITADDCTVPVQISHTDNVNLSNVRIINHEGDKPPIDLSDCRGVFVRDVLFQNISCQATALLLQNCDETLIDGFVLRGDVRKVTSAVCYRIRGNGMYSGLRISNVSARLVTDAGVVLELHDQKEGSLNDYVIVQNAATVRDGIHGERAIIADNLP